MTLIAILLLVAVVVAREAPPAPPLPEAVCGVPLLRTPRNEEFCTQKWQTLSLGFYKNSFPDRVCVGQRELSRTCEKTCHTRAVSHCRRHKYTRGRAPRIFMKKVIAEYAPKLDNEKNSAKFCREWFEKETENPEVERKLNNVLNILSCPPTNHAAKVSPCMLKDLSGLSPTFLDHFHPGATSSFRSIPLKGSGLKYKPAVQCCYGPEGNLLLHPNDYGAGTVDFAPATESTEAHAAQDVAPYYACCVNSEECHLYDLLRPRPTVALPEMTHVAGCIAQQAVRVTKHSDCTRYAKSVCVDAEFTFASDMRNCVQDFKLGCLKKKTELIRAERN